MASHVVARADEIPPGSRKLVQVGGRSIGVFNIGGRYYALRNRCPHQGGPLCEGFVVAGLSADRPGEYDHRSDAAFLRCPWHGWEFDVRTGKSWFDPAGTRVRAYDVGVRSGAEVPDAGESGTAQAGGRTPGPHVAETYDVSVRDAHVVVEVGSART
jgi:nitrite reductase/ring-hydroxylating ferredoxin subunit